MSLVSHCETSVWFTGTAKLASVQSKLLFTFHSLLVITALAFLLGSAVLKS